MATRTLAEDMAGDTLADLLERLGNVPLDRIRMHPAPGTATEQDVVAALEAGEKHLCELVDRVLVEKPMGTREGLLAGIILHRLWSFLEQHKLGKAFGADSAMRLMPGLVRIPDVSFVSRERLRTGNLRTRKIAEMAPDLAVEVLSASNTRGEIQRKLRDYFLAGVRLVWLVRPDSETAEVYHGPDRKKRVGKKGVLGGEDILPGFTLSLPDLFALADEEA